MGRHSSISAIAIGAPFLFFNSNTFADIAREATSAIAHYGVLDRESMVAIVESLCEVADWKPGERVQTFRGSTRGVIVRLLDNGRVVWRPDGTQSELMALPESLLREMCSGTSVPRLRCGGQQQLKQSHKESTARHKYQAAVVRCGFHFWPKRSKGPGSGSARFP